MILERCCTSLEEVLEAKENGASRVELCTRIEVGGLTPPRHLIKEAVASGIPVNVLIREREGDFFYSPEELGKMADDVCFCRDCGANAVVVGALRNPREIDCDAIRLLLAGRGGMKATFHRAFDVMEGDPFRALEDIISLGCDTLLTSGRQDTALQGAELIRQLVVHARGRIAILAGSGVCPENLEELRAKTGADEFHGTKLCTSQNANK